MTLLKKPGQVITFYSYKGGTGRTMALANVACLLAQQVSQDKPVLIVDWDLEAPGLHRYFQPYLKNTNDSELCPGLIDLFEEFKKNIELWDELDENNVEESTHKLLEEIRIQDFILKTNIANLHLLKAGYFDKDYSRKVNNFDWVSFYQKAPDLIRLFSEKLTRKYQYILIDSRTGVTDTSGICTMIMPEKLVAVFTPNRQSLLGVLEQVKKSTNYRRQSDDLRPLVVFPLPSRIEPAEPGLRKEWRFGNSDNEVPGYQQEFEKLFIEVYGLTECTLDPYFDEIQIQHIPRYAYGEQIAVLIENAGDRLSLARSYESFTEDLIKLSKPWEHEERLTSANVESISVSEFLEKYGIDEDSITVVQEQDNRRELTHRVDKARSIVMLSLVMPMIIIPLWLLWLLLPINSAKYSERMQSAFLAALVSDVLGLYYIVTRDLFPKDKKSSEEDV